MSTYTCRECGCKKARFIEIVDNRVNGGEGADAVITAGYLCDACFGPMLDKAEDFRRQFEQLRSEGLSRELANEIMCQRVDAYHAKKRGQERKGDA